MDKALNGLSRLSWRPGALRLVGGPSRRSYGLGQLTYGLLTVVVVDSGGKPVGDAQVEVLQAPPESARTMTDGHGHASFSLVPGTYDVRVTYKDLTILKRYTDEEFKNGLTLFIQFPICIVDPIFRPMDLVIFGGAGALIAAGSYWKVKPIEMAGEIALGAAMFGFIYRLQCL